MPSDETDKQKRKEAASSILKDMEATAARMRALIISMPPLDLLGYIYVQYILKFISEQEGAKTDHEVEISGNFIDENQFLLEYVHAVFASDVSPENVEFNEAACAELYELGRQLQQQAMFYAMATSAATTNSAFGSDTADIEFRAKFTWVSLRGNRYQVLEEEFYRYVLTPHDDVLREVYGVGADDVARGFQAMANAVRSGHANAIDEVYSQITEANAFASAEGKPLNDAIEDWGTQNPDRVNSARQAFDDLFQGGVTNVSRHANFPHTLLSDIAYERGEETEFFAPGDFSGTPYRTLPARKKPLIRLGSDYYAVDPCFVRDAGYRALLFNLLQRKPAYKKVFDERQKVMSEAAFADIMSAQLPGATVLRDIYYRDLTSREWVENDTLILIDDMLLLIEAKAGAAATIASPALDFGRHVQSVQELVIKAYKQCERFFEYLNSANNVPLYQLIGGKHIECAHIRSADYRIMVPIGLTVESFAPFSAFCKELPQVIPLLGKHAFVSLSIDDLFVLKRLLPTPGEFAHYMEVRQAMAGLRGAHLFDEIDHLGAYLTKNRFDMEMADQLKDGKAHMVSWVHMNDAIDRSFEGEDWERRSFPAQKFPVELQNLLRALDARRAPGWLSAERCIRNFDDRARDGLANALTTLRQSLKQHPARYFIYGTDPQLFIWLQKSGETIDWKKVHDKALAAALLVPDETTSIMVEATASGTYTSARTFEVTKPSSRNADNAHIYDDAERLERRRQNYAQPPTVQFSTIPQMRRKLGRNDPCTCGSGLKYKKCHGR